MAASIDTEQRPIPASWRQTFKDIIAAFVVADFRLDRGVPGVQPISDETAAQIRDYIADYGATLVPLPEETWISSVCMWHGTGWDALVDLWTQEEGRSDLVLHALVSDDAAGVSIKVHLVYVP